MGALADAAGRPAGGSAAATAAPGAACATDLTGCAHCGLPVAPALVEAGAERQFCCAGCRTVWSVIHEHGLDRYYGLRDDSGARARPARVLGRSYAAFDDPHFLERYARPDSGRALRASSCTWKACTARPASGWSSACRASSRAWSRSGLISAVRARW